MNLTSFVSCVHLLPFFPLSFFGWPWDFAQRADEKGRGCKGQGHGRGRRAVRLRVRAVVSSDSRVVAQSMQMRKLGDSDLVISEVTLGTVSASGVCRRPL